MANLILPAPPSLLKGQNPHQNTNLCDECGASAWKYRCPGCAIKSCSLSCVNSHKARTSCTGKRNRTEFVPLSKFDDNLLVSDYNLLEETRMAAESARRMAGSIDGFRGYIGFKLPRSILMLRNAANRRGTKLLLLPPAMSKRKMNQSRFDRKKNSISWTIEWRFHATDVVLVDHFVNENVSLMSVIEKHLTPTPLKNQLTPYRNVEINNLKFFIRKTPKGLKSPFRELDINAPLSEQLPDVVILEYPVIYVFLPSHNYEFEVENDSKPASKRQVVLDCSDSPKGNLFIEEEIEEGEVSSDTVVTDLMGPTDSVHNAHMTRALQDYNTQISHEVTECSKPVSGSSTYPEKPIGDVNFDFQQELRDAYSELLGDMNPDDFLCFDDGYNELSNLESIFARDELEEGEIP